MYTCNYKLLFKYFKSNLHQNKLVLISVEKNVVCNVHFKSAKIKSTQKKIKFRKTKSCA